MRPHARGIRDLVARLGMPLRAGHPDRCVNCGITIDGDDDEGPQAKTDAARVNPAYCCDGCADGGPCTC